MVCELVGDQIVDDIANRISPRTDCKVTTPPMTITTLME